MEKIDCLSFLRILESLQIDFFTGVPDSLLKDFCSCLLDNTTRKQHVITSNEGAAIALASGYHLATGRIPLVYLQNSGIGNAVNPLLSLADKEVYGIPMILMIGWRGEPGLKDEPQHIKQGRVQNAMLDAMEIPYRILDISKDKVETHLECLTKIAKKDNTPVALIIKKGTFQSYENKKNTTNDFILTREDAIKIILKQLEGDEIIVSTTGKTSRELFELRRNNHRGSTRDFLTVGSMGHASQIALGISLFSDRKVICLDGDGSVIMHMGALPIIGSIASGRFIHIIINNGAHDSVGGQPTVGFDIDFVNIAKACGYSDALSVKDETGIEEAFRRFSSMQGPVLLEVLTRKGARIDLGRPSNTPRQNMESFMRSLNSYEL